MQATPFKVQPSPTVHTKEALGKYVGENPSSTGLFCPRFQWSQDCTIASKNKAAY